MNLTLERAIELNKDMVTQENLIIHSKNVMAAMEAMAKHFGEDADHWKAIGYLHDYDYEKYPEEHLKHTEEPLREAGVSEEDLVTGMDFARMWSRSQIWRRACLRLMNSRVLFRPARGCARTA